MGVGTSVPSLGLSVPVEGSGQVCGVGTSVPSLGLSGPVERSGRVCGVWCGCLRPLSESIGACRAVRSGVWWSTSVPSRGLSVSVERSGRVSGMSTSVPSLRLSVPVERSGRSVPVCRRAASRPVYTGPPPTVFVCGLLCSGPETVFCTGLASREISQQDPLGDGDCVRVHVGSRI